MTKSLSSTTSTTALQRDRADEAVGAKHPVIRGSLHGQGGPPDPGVEISRPGGLAARFASGALARGSHKPSAPPRPYEEPGLEQGDLGANELDPVARAERNQLTECGATESSHVGAPTGE